VVVLYGSGNGEPKNQAVAEQLRNCTLQGPVIVAERYDYISNYNDTGEGDDADAENDDE
jgi:hypothetical protein